MDCKTSLCLHCTVVALTLPCIQVEKAREVKMAISQQITRVISAHCHCSVPDNLLQNGLFTCWNTPNVVTFRNKIISNTVNTSKLVDYIIEWVNTEQPYVQVGDFGLKVYKDCPVRISSMNDPDCASAELSTNVPSVIASSDPKVIRCINFCLEWERGEALCPMP